MHFARNKPAILHMQTVKVSSKAEPERCELHSGRRSTRCPLLKTYPPPILSAVSTDMPGRYRYGLCTAAASEINGCVKGDDPHLICSCLTLLPLVAGPGCCIPGGLLQFFRRNSAFKALCISADARRTLRAFARTCGFDSQKWRV